MRPQFQARRYRWARALLVGFLVDVWLLPSTTNATDLKGFDATGPNKDYPDKMMLYGRLVGDWRVEYTAYSADEKKQPTIEWHFGSQQARSRYGAGLTKQNCSYHNFTVEPTVTFSLQ